MPLPSSFHARSSFSPDVRFLRSTLMLALVSMGAILSAGCAPQDKTAEQSGTKSSAAPIFITDGKTSWNLAIKDIPADRPIAKDRTFYVYSFHSEVFPNRYAVAQSRGIYQAFEAVSRQYPDTQFVVAVVLNKASTQDAVNKSSTQDEGPTKGRYYDFLETVFTPEDQLDPFFSKQTLQSAGVAVEGKNLVDSNPVTPVVLHSPEDPYSILTDFDGNNILPRYFITDRQGKIIRSTHSTETGQDRFAEAMEYLHQLTHGAAM